MNMSDAQDRPLILVVDDTPDNLTLMSELLQELYRVKVANSGERAMKIALTAMPDLILLDIMMPDADGYEVARRLKSNPRTHAIPIVFLTSRSSIEDEQRGFELGAVDYIVKPISPPLVLARVKTHLTLKAAADFLRDKNEFLEREVEKRTSENTAIQNVTIQVVTSLAETRDQETGHHIRRTQSYVRLIAARLSQTVRYRSTLTASAIATMYRSAPLHDIGKVGIPDHILLKPGKLTVEEFEIMKTHTRVGCAAIERAEEQLGMEVDFLKTAKQIALSHHERWDGTGYPQGLQGDEIPLAARVMAVADVYDALVSTRVYKEAMAHTDALRLITAGSGSHFDPEVVEAFLAVESDVQDIAERFKDHLQSQSARDQQPEPVRTAHLKTVH